MKKARGGKVNRSHSSVIDDAKTIVTKAENWDEVTKISLGRITWGLRKPKRGVSVTVDRNCVIATVTMPHSKQVLFFYSEKPEKTAARLRAKKVQ